MSLEAAVPVGSEAEIVLPKLNIRDIVVKEGGKAIWTQKKFVPGVPGILGVQETATAIVIKTGSGRYVFDLTGD
jgi:hypothetical protein